MQEALGENGCQNGCQTETSASPDEQKSQNSEGKVVSRIFASWNQIAGWLRRLEGLRDAA